MADGRGKGADKLKLKGDAEIAKALTAFRGNASQAAVHLGYSTASSLVRRINSTPFLKNLLNELRAKYGSANARGALVTKQQLGVQKVSDTDIEMALRRCCGSQVHAARELGINVKTLKERLDGNEFLQAVLAELPMEYYGEGIISLRAHTLGSKNAKGSPWAIAKTLEIHAPKEQRTKTFEVTGPGGGAILLRQDPAQTALLAAHALERLEEWEKSKGISQADSEAAPTDGSGPPPAVGPASNGNNGDEDYLSAMGALDDEDDEDQDEDVEDDE